MAHSDIGPHFFAATVLRIGCLQHDAGVAQLPLVLRGGRLTLQADIADLAWRPAAAGAAPPVAAQGTDRPGIPAGAAGPRPVPAAAAAHADAAAAQGPAGPANVTDAGVAQHERRSAIAGVATPCTPAQHPAGSSAMEHQNTLAPDASQRHLTHAQQTAPVNAPDNAPGGRSGRDGDGSNHGNEGAHCDAEAVHDGAAVKLCRCCKAVALDNQLLQHCSACTKALARMRKVFAHVATVHFNLHIARGCLCERLRAEPAFLTSEAWAAGGQASMEALFGPACFDAQSGPFAGAVPLRPKRSLHASSGAAATGGADAQQKRKLTRQSAQQHARAAAAAPAAPAPAPRRGARAGTDVDAGAAAAGGTPLNGSGGRPCEVCDAVAPLKDGVCPDCSGPFRRVRELKYTRPEWSVPMADVWRALRGKRALWAGERWRGTGRVEFAEALLGPRRRTALRAAAQAHGTAGAAAAQAAARSAAPDQHIKTPSSAKPGTSCVQKRERPEERQVAAAHKGEPPCSTHAHAGASSKRPCAGSERACKWCACALTVLRDGLCRPCRTLKQRVYNRVTRVHGLQWELAPLMHAVAAQGAAFWRTEQWLAGGDGAMFALLGADCFEPGRIWQRADGAAPAPAPPPLLRSAAALHARANMTAVTQPLAADVLDAIGSAGPCTTCVAKQLAPLGRAVHIEPASRRGHRAASPTLPSPAAAQRAASAARAAGASAGAVGGPAQRARAATSDGAGASQGPGHSGGLLMLPCALGVRPRGPERAGVLSDADGTDADLDSLPAPFGTPAHAAGACAPGSASEDRLLHAGPLFGSPAHTDAESRDDSVHPDDSEAAMGAGLEGACTGAVAAVQGHAAPCLAVCRSRCDAAGRGALVSTEALQDVAAGSTAARAAASDVDEGRRVAAEIAAAAVAAVVACAGSQ